MSKKNDGWEKRFSDSFYQMGMCNKCHKIRIFDIESNEWENGLDDIKDFIRQTLSQELSSFAKEIKVEKHTEGEVAREIDIVARTFYNLAIDEQAEKIEKALKKRGLAVKQILEEGK